MEDKYTCPCCGHKTLSNNNTLFHEICPVCFWENDPLQNKNPEYSGGANRVCLSKAKENYKKYGAVEEQFIKFVRKPNKGE